MNPINVRQVVLEELLRMREGGESHEMAARWIAERLNRSIHGRLSMMAMQAQMVVSEEPEPTGPMPPGLEDKKPEALVRATVRATKRAIFNRLQKLFPLQATHRHRLRTTVYVEIARGRLQTEVPIRDGHPLVAYHDSSGDWWFRPPEEFDEVKRFERL